MIWLLGQIALCLLLAAIGGWYVGWTLRGFRERDRLEDLRRTLRTTEEVKRRELGEAEQRIEALEAELAALRAGASRRAGEQPPAGGGGAPGPQRAAVGSATAAPDLSATTDHPSAEAGTGAEAPAGGGGADEYERRLAEAEARCRALEAEREQLRARLREGQRADDRRLQERQAESVALRAEVASLRRALQDKAEQIARLEATVIELEPLQLRLRERDADLERLRAGLQEQRERAEALAEQARQGARELAELRERLHERDREINALRVRAQDAAARAEQVEQGRERHRQELAECSRMLASLENELAETRQRLQRQIERNRKQEVVHRSVVADLQRRLQEAHGRLGSAPRGNPAPQTPAGAAAAPAQSPARNRTPPPAEPEAGGDRQSAPVDDLKAIRGIGPKIERSLYEMGITRYEQIASWTDEDVARVAARLRAFPERIRWDRWIEQARALARARSR